LTYWAYYHNLSSWFAVLTKHRTITLWFRYNNIYLSVLSIQHLFYIGDYRCFAVSTVESMVYLVLLIPVSRVVSTADFSSLASIYLFLCMSSVSANKSYWWFLILTDQEKACCFLYAAVFLSVSVYICAFAVIENYIIS